MSTRRNGVVVFGPWPPPYGGVASHVQDLVQNLAQRGVSVGSLCYGEFRQTRRLRKISVAREGWWRTLFRLYLALSPGKILHDHSGLIPNPDAGLIRSFYSVIQARRSRWVLTLHDETLLGRFPAWPQATRDVCSRFLRSPDHVICVGSRLEAFLAELGVPSCKVSNVPPLLPIGEGPQVSLPTEIQAFLADHRPVITTIGAFHANYDFATVARAFPTILAKYPAAGLVLIDAGFTADDEHRKSVLKALDGIAPAAYCLLCKVPRQHVFQILRASAAFIRGARLESFGLSRAEAIMLGTPVITTEAGETRYMRLYEFGNAARLTSEVLDVLGSPADLSEAQQFYRTLAERTLDRVLAVYERAQG